MDTGTEQQAQLADVQMPMNCAPTARLKMVHTEVPLGQFKTSFDRPAGKGYPQHPFQRYTAGYHSHVGHEVFHFVRVQNIAGDDQRMAWTGQAFLAMLAVKLNMFDLPDKRSFLTIFDLESLPLLLLKLTRINQQVSHFTRRQRFSRQSRVVAFWPAFIGILRPGAVQNPRFVRPSDKVRRNLANVILPQGVKPVEELTVPSVLLVEGPGGYANSVAHRPANLAQRNDGFLSIHGIIRNACFLATGRIVSPTFGQVQIAVKQTLKIASHIRNMNADYTVVDLPGITAPLPLDRGGMCTLLGVTCTIDDANSLRMSVIASYNPLDSISYALLVPLGRSEKALQRSRRYASRQSDGFYTFSRQVRDLPADVGSQFFPRLTSGEAIVEFSQESLQFFAHIFDSFDVHVDTPYILRIYKELSKQAA